MPVWLGMVNYLQTLTDNQQNQLRSLEKIIIWVFGSVLVGTVLTLLQCMTSSGFVEFYINDFWIVE